MNTKHSKSPLSKFFKKLKTRYPLGGPKRNPVADINYSLSQQEFKLVWPANLRDRVQNKSAGAAIPYECLPLMTLMLNCLKSHDYNQTSCGTEITQFYNCHNQHVDRVKLERENESKGIYNVEDGQRRYPTKLVNQLLKRNPNPKKYDSGPEVD